MSGADWGFVTGMALLIIVVLGVPTMANRNIIVETCLDIEAWRDAGNPMDRKDTKYYRKHCKDG